MILTKEDNLKERVVDYRFRINQEELQNLTLSQKDITILKYLDCEQSSVAEKLLAITYIARKIENETYNNR